jgi:hypothetical protein
MRGEGGRCVGLTALPSSCADCLEIYEPQPPRRLRACTGIASPKKRVATSVIYSVKAVEPRRCGAHFFAYTGEK